MHLLANSSVIERAGAQQSVVRKGKYCLCRNRFASWHYPLSGCNAQYSRKLAIRSPWYSKMATPELTNILQPPGAEFRCWVGQRRG
jgi:hypothetical protein